MVEEHSNNCMCPVGDGGGTLQQLYVSCVPDTSHLTILSCPLSLILSTFRMFTPRSRHYHPHALELIHNRNFYFLSRPLFQIFFSQHAHVRNALLPFLRNVRIEIDETLFATPPHNR